MLSVLLPDTTRQHQPTAARQREKMSEDKQGTVQWEGSANFKSIAPIPFIPWGAVC